MHPTPLWWYFHVSDMIWATFFIFRWHVFMFFFCESVPNHEASKPRSLEASKPRSLEASSCLGGNREAKSIYQESIENKKNRQIWCRWYHSQQNDLTKKMHLITYPETYDTSSKIQLFHLRLNCSKFNISIPLIPRLYASSCFGGNREAKSIQFLAPQISSAGPPRGSHW